MSTNIVALDRAISNTILWLNDVQDELQWPDKDRVYKATKAVLQAIRDRLPFEEVIHFSANLPMLMKGMLFDGYDLKDKPVRIRTLEEFFTCIQGYYDGQGRNIVSPDEAARGVINMLFKRMAPEMKIVADNMPEKLRPLFQPRTEEQAAEASRKRTTKRQLEIPQTP